MARNDSTQSHDRPLALGGKSLFSITPVIEVNECLEGMLDRIETAHAMVMAATTEGFNSLCPSLKEGYCDGLIHVLSELRDLHDHIHSYLLIIQQEYAKKG